MQRGGGEREQDALFAEFVRYRNDARAGRDEMRRGAAEQAAHGAEATRAGNENRVARLQARLRAGFDDRSDGFIAGNQRIAHAGEGRHPAGKEQALGAGADAAPTGLDHDIARRRRVELEPREREALRLLQDDGERTRHDRPFPRDTLSLAGVSV